MEITIDSEELNSNVIDAKAIINELKIMIENFDGRDISECIENKIKLCESLVNNIKVELSMLPKSFSNRVNIIELTETFAETKKKYNCKLNNFQLQTFNKNEEKSALLSPPKDGPHGQEPLKRPQRAPHTILKRVSMVNRKTFVFLGLIVILFIVLNIYFFHYRKN